MRKLVILLFSVLIFTGCFEEKPEQAISTDILIGNVVPEDHAGKVYSDDILFRIPGSRESFVSVRPDNSIYIIKYDGNITIYALEEIKDE